jgi:hypothetical protein
MLTPMRTGIGLILVLGAVAWGCAPATKVAAPATKVAAPASPAVKPDEKRSRVDPKPATPGELEARVEGNLVTVAGKAYEGKELAEELGRLRGGAKVLKVRVTPGSTDVAFADALEAAAKAGFEHVAIDHGGEQLTAELSDGAEQVRIVSWRSNDRVIVFDLKPRTGTSGWLGSFDFTDTASIASLREKVAAACQQQPCTTELDLLPEARPTVWQTLSTWHRAMSDVPALSYRVLAMVPRPKGDAKGFPLPSEAAPAGPAAPGSKPPKVRLGATTVSGRLRPAVIQQIVRSNFGRFRVCYESGLGRNSELTGRVSARFVIGRDGKVSNVADGGSDVPDAEVVSCTLQAFYGIEFPPPANGIVTVVYPIMFAPG